ncbi:hypothetical protein [Herbaspirillum sp. alder98]|uniref:hypothetical protein n=1 Tax=Herbaspirillum sp. alder98 TaxID=2913096 RepID=UPI001CD87237|nr:hypothetical protein [Herbaspirillum sp. alder98]MCA1323460.1 hypothetical protein [Herbaspirillum sp. alder98]
MNKKILATGFLLLNALANGAMAAPEDVTTADPSRWFKAEDTPQGRYGNHLIEARAAHAQALQECKTVARNEVRRCRKEAHDAMKEDKARAKRILEHAQSNE